MENKVSTEGKPYRFRTFCLIIDVPRIVTRLRAAGILNREIARAHARGMALEELIEERFNEVLRRELEERAA